MRRFGWAAYLLMALLAVGGPLYCQERSEQQRRKSEQLIRQMDNLQQVYRETVRELTMIHDENRELLLELDEALSEIEIVKGHHAELETILLNQRQTYRDAVTMNGASMAVLTHSSFTARQYERAWDRLGAGGLLGTGEALVLAEERYGVNSLVLAAIAFLESAGGRSRLACDKHNLFGLGAGGPDPYGSALSFSSREESIRYAARLLRSRYLDRGSRIYRGENLLAIAANYASDPQWAEKVGRAMSRIARAAIPGSP